MLHFRLLRTCNDWKLEQTDAPLKSTSSEGRIKLLYLFAAVLNSLSVFITLR